jgi:hypothetical protein
MRAVKPAPVPPPTATAQPKPHHRSTTARLSPQVNYSDWAVTLTASPHTLWPEQYSLLTATANHDVLPTPHYIVIYDDASWPSGQPLAVCGSGTTCTAWVTQPASASVHYDAMISAGTTLTAWRVATDNVWVDWQGVGVSLTADPTTVSVNGVTTLTATTTTDIGPSPFYIEIYDATMWTRLTACGFGTSCSVPVSEPVAATHVFFAYVSNYSTAVPPTGVQATSNANYVTWASSGWQVVLSANPQVTAWATTVTAVASGDVGPTPYYIEIFSEDGTLLADCAYGSTCSLTYAPSYGGVHLVAFVSSYSAFLPPRNIQATSNVVEVRELI